MTAPAPSPASPGEQSPRQCELCAQVFTTEREFSVHECPALVSERKERIPRPASLADKRRFWVELLLRSLVLVLASVLMERLFAWSWMRHTSDAEGLGLTLAFILYIVAWWRYAPVKRWWAKLPVVIIGILAGMMLSFAGVIAVILGALLLRRLTDKDFWGPS